MSKNIQAEIEEEIKEFSKLITKYPDLEELYIGRAILYTKIGEYEKAIKDYKKAHEDYIYDIIAICKRHNLTEEVEKFYTRKINKDKNNIVNYMSRARFYMSINKNKKALEDCNNILKISPKNNFVLGMKLGIMKKLEEEEKHEQQENPSKILLT